MLTLPAAAIGRDGREGDIDNILIDLVEVERLREAAPSEALAQTSFWLNVSLVVEEGTPSVSN